MNSSIPEYPNHTVSCSKCKSHAHTGQRRENVEQPIRRDGEETQEEEKVKQTSVFFFHRNAPAQSVDSDRKKSTDEHRSEAARQQKGHCSADG